MTSPPYLNPFVLPTADRVAEHHGPVELFLPAATQPRPAVVIVPGGPSPAALRPIPRDWPVYRGYGSLVADRGLVGVTVAHRLHDFAGYPLAAADVAAAVDLARADPRVDGDRVAVWFFSGSSLLLADWLRTPPSWLRCAALTYPVLAPLPGWDVDPRFRPVQAVAEAGSLPIVLTRVGLDNPQFAATVDAFTEAASACAARLEVIDVPDGQHGFDYLDHTGQSRDAVERAMDLVSAALT
jgi:hypothetical protein